MRVRPEPLTKGQLRRRTVRLCIIFLRNLAYYRAGQSEQGNHMLDPAEPTVNFWRQANSNFIDMCVLDWCKIFADRKAVHHWRKIVFDPVKFEGDLLARLTLTADEFQQFLDKIRFYRDKFIAHLDEHNTMDIPCWICWRSPCGFTMPTLLRARLNRGIWPGYLPTLPKSSI